MVKILKHSDPIIANKIHDIFQISYAIEARILKADYFPPLHRSAKDIESSNTYFFGIWKDKKIISVIEIKTNNSSTHIQSLLVHPQYFRKGIARKMLQFTVDHFTTNITVETGLNNYPAVMLYKQFGFAETKTYLTTAGIMKIAFELIKCKI